MEIKPPVAAAIIVVVLVLAFVGFKMYDNHVKSANAGPPLSKGSYMPPPGAFKNSGQ